MPKESFSPGRVHAERPTLWPQIPWRVVWPVFVYVTLCVAGASFINSESHLVCERTGEVMPPGDCTLERGSWAFAYTETFLVTGLKGARVVGYDEQVANRALDGGGERVYVETTLGPMRFIDNDRWTHNKRLKVAADIRAFVEDPTRKRLEVRFDRRLELLLKAFGAAALLGALHALFRWKCKSVA